MSGQPPPSHGEAAPDTRTTPASPSPGRGGWRAFVALGVVLLGLGVLTWEAMPVGVWHDDGVYVLLGRSLAEGHGLRYSGVSAEPPATKFPPAYPALVAAVWWSSPEFPANVRLIAGLNLLLMALAGSLFAYWCHGAVGLSLPLSLAATGTAWLSMDLWRVAAIPLSEPLFLVTLLLALLWGHRAERPDSTGWAWWLFFLGFALVFHTRTIGVAVGAAAVLSAAVAGRWRRAVGLGAGMAVVMAPWILWSTRRSTDVPAPLRDILGSYGGWLSGRLGADPLGFLAMMPMRAWNLADWCLAVLLPGAPLGLRWSAGLLLLALVTVGVWDLTSRSRLGGLTVLLMLGALWVWPFIDRRLMAPLVPWLVLAAFLGAQRSAAWLGRSRPAGREAHDTDLRARLHRLPWAAVAFWAVAFAVVSVSGLLGGTHEAGYRLRARALADAVDAVRRTTGDAAVVGAPELWAGLNLYTGRTVGPSAPFRPGGVEGPAWGTPADQYRLWLAAGLDHVLVEHAGAVHGQALDRMDALCPGGAVEVRASYDGGFLVRLNWDEACRSRLLSPER